MATSAPTAAASTAPSRCATPGRSPDDRGHSHPRSGCLVGRAALVTGASRGIGRAIALRRFLEPREIAEPAVYIGSTDSHGMTGQSLLIDGGMLMV